MIPDNDEPLLPPMQLHDEPEMEHGVTGVSSNVHEPIGSTVRSLRRQIYIALAANLVVLLGLAYVIYFDAVRLGVWRQTGRDIQLENQRLLRELLAQRVGPAGK